MREIDCNRKSNLTDKSLIKSETKFKKYNASYHGGTHGSQGKFFKTSHKPGHSPKSYYRASRTSYHEYFAFELLNAIGFSTPKARFIDSEKGTIEIITKEIEHYMPLQAYCDWWPNSRFLNKTLEVKEVQNKYRFEAQSQVILDKQLNQPIRISGNLFASNIGAYLLQDTDLSAEGTNLSLVKEGDRFYVYFIDKEFATFYKKVNYQELTQIDTGLERLFEHQTMDQKLTVIYSIQKLITPDKSTGESTLEKIFFNNRTASIYKFYLQKMVQQKALNAIENLCSAFVIENTGLINKLLRNTLVTRLLYLKNSPVFKELQQEIKLAVKEKFKTLNVEPKNMLNNPQNVAEYLTELELIPHQIIQEVISSNAKYTNLTAADILELVIGKDTLKNNTDYMMQPCSGISSDQTKSEFKFQTNMSIEQFTMNHFALFYDSPQTGYIENPNLRGIAPFDPLSMYQNILNNAECIVNHTLGEKANSLKEFEERESYRIKIAYKIMENVGDDANKFDAMHHCIFTNIIEDLRGPFYQDFFKNKKTVSAADVENDDLINQLYNDNNVKAEELRAQVKSKLRVYINRINNGNENNINFSIGFNHFVSTQTMNRRANYHLALKLLEQLENKQSITSIFDLKNIDALRQQFFAQQGVLSKLVSFNVFGWGIHSQELNSIINAVHEHNQIKSEIRSICS